MITVLGRATSSNVQAVMRCATEPGLEVDRPDYGGAFGGAEADDCRRLNPNRLVPTLAVGDEGVWESAAVVRCLAAEYGDEAFRPRQPLARARLDKGAEWGKVTLSAAFLFPSFVAHARNRPEDRDDAAIARAAKTLDPLLGVLDAHLARSPFIGEVFSFADIVPGHLMFRLHELMKERDLGLAPRPHVSRDYAALQKRPAFHEHAMISCESLRPA